MDWSLLQRGTKHPFLRKELIYTNHIWVRWEPTYHPSPSSTNPPHLSLQVYYFALVTNCLIRFGWIIYLPISGPHPNIRGGILGVLEALRRFQWNFFRLENEHLGNADQYRVTREVPLPYSVDPAELSDGGDEDDPVTPRTSPRSPLKLSTLRKSPRAGRTSQG
jgi:xenotropic and polytropic retrovirus receptor 1